MWMSQVHICTVWLPPPEQEQSDCFHCSVYRKVGHLFGLVYFLVGYSLSCSVSVLEPPANLISLMLHFHTDQVCLDQFTFTLVLYTVVLNSFY